MADNTKIEWTDATANFWIGCTKLSAACDHCYAEADWDHRKHRVTWGPHGARDFCKAGEQVVRRMHRKAAAFIAEHGRKPLIFVNSLSDFADNHRSIRPEWRAKVWQLARECPDVILQILTKRPQNLPDYLPEDWGAGYPNVWLGTTVENQEEADRRIPHLLATPAAIRWLSCEPLLGALRLDRIAYPDSHYEDWLAGEAWDVNGDLTPEIYGANHGPKLDWIVAGGESGPGARPMHPDWARSLRDQCVAAGVPFFFKQWGSYLPAGKIPDTSQYSAMDPQKPWVGPHPLHTTKRFAGRLLDGVTHDAMPEAAHG